MINTFITGNAGISISYINDNRENRYAYPVKGREIAASVTGIQFPGNGKTQVPFGGIRTAFKKGWAKLQIPKMAGKENEDKFSGIRPPLKEKENRIGQRPDWFAFKPGRPVLKKENSITEKDNSPKEDILPERRIVHITPEQVKRITLQLEDLMNKEKPFLKQGYTIKDMAWQPDIPAYQLSAFINLEAGTNFNEFINKLRIPYCQDIIKKGDAADLNLFGLATKCGFSNRNTFTAAFKNFAGSTPSSFLRPPSSFLLPPS